MPNVNKDFSWAIKYFKIIKWIRNFTNFIRHLIPFVKSIFVNGKIVKS